MGEEGGGEEGNGGDSEKGVHGGANGVEMEDSVRRK